MSLMMIFMIGTSFDYVPAPAPNPLYHSSDDWSGGCWKDCKKHWANPPAFLKCYVGVVRCIVHGGW